MRRYISSGSTPAASRRAAIAWHRGDVLLKRNPPVSVRIATYSAVAIAGVIVEAERHGEVEHELAGGARGRCR